MRDSKHEIEEAITRLVEGQSDDELLRGMAEGVKNTLYRDGFRVVSAGGPFSYSATFDVWREQSPVLLHVALWYADDVPGPRSGLTVEVDVGGTRPVPGASYRPGTGQPGPDYTVSSERQGVKLSGPNDTADWISGVYYDALAAAEGRA